MLKYIITAITIAAFVSPTEALNGRSHASEMPRLGASAINRMQLEEGQSLLAQVNESGIECDICKTVVSTIIKVLDDPTLSNYTLNWLLRECDSHYSDHFFNSACRLIVKVMVYALPDGINELRKHDWDIPFNLCAIFRTCTQDCCSTPHTPEQVLLTLADSSDFTKMRVTWVTLNTSDDADVKYTKEGSNDAKVVPIESTRTYTTAGWIGVINTAIMENLVRGSQYSYSVGSDTKGRSQTFTFRVFPLNIGSAERPLRILSIADMDYGELSNYTIKRMAARAKAGLADLVIHNGGISYADGYMRHWDMFMRKISDVTSTIPYMTTPGNHEIYENFTAYRMRLGGAMPPAPGQLSGSMFYSLNIGPTKLLLMNSESVLDRPHISKEQVQWVDAELGATDRQVQPWVIAFHHRALYCTDPTTLDCYSYAKELRDAVEDVYAKHKVDLVAQAHMHYYLRAYPISHGEVTSTNYTNPTSPTYIINGAAGNREVCLEVFVDSPMFVKGTNETGYGVIEVAGNQSLRHIFYISRNDTVFDEIEIKKTYRH